MIEEAKSKIGKKVEVTYVENDFIKKEIFTLKDIRSYEDKLLCYFEESPLICNYNTIKEIEDG